MFTKSNSDNRDIKVQTKDIIDANNEIELLKLIIKFNNTFSKVELSEFIFKFFSTTNPERYSKILKLLLETNTIDIEMIVTFLIQREYLVLENKNYIPLIDVVMEFILERKKAVLYNRYISGLFYYINDNVTDFPLIIMESIINKRLELMLCIIEYLFEHPVAKMSANSTDAWNRHVRIYLTNESHFYIAPDPYISERDFITAKFVYDCSQKIKNMIISSPRHFLDTFTSANISKTQMSFRNRVLIYSIQNLSENSPNPPCMFVIDLAKSIMKEFSPNKISLLKSLFSFEYLQYVLNDKDINQFYATDLLLIDDHAQLMEETKPFDINQILDSINTTEIYNTYFKRELQLRELITSKYDMKLHFLKFDTPDFQYANKSIDNFNASNYLRFKDIVNVYVETFYDRCKYINKGYLTSSYINPDNYLIIPVMREYLYSFDKSIYGMASFKICEDHIFLDLICENGQFIMTLLILIAIRLGKQYIRLESVKIQSTINFYKKYFFRRVENEPSPDGLILMCLDVSIFSKNADLYNKLLTRTLPPPPEEIVVQKQAMDEDEEEEEEDDEEDDIIPQTRSVIEKAPRTRSVFQKAPRTQSGNQKISLTPPDTRRRRTPTRRTVERNQQQSRRNKINNVRRSRVRNN